MGEKDPLRFLFVLASGPERTSLDTVLGLAEASLQAGHLCAVFFTGDGVRHLLPESISSFDRRIADLARNGIAFFHCRESVRQKGLHRVSMLPSVIESSLAKMVELVDGSDRSLVFD